MHWFVIVIFAVEGLLNVLANGLTIVIFLSSRRLRRKQYIMIISQAVADLLIGLVSIPVFIVFIQNKENYFIFKLHRVQDNLLGLASLFGLAAMSIERAHATYFPFRHSSLGKVPYIVGVVLMWTLPLIGVIPHLLSQPKNITGNIRAGTICIILVVISTAYFLIVWKVRNGSSANGTGNQGSVINIQENKKLTVTLAIVTIISLAMWLPYQFLVFVYANLSINSLNGEIYYTKTLHYGNSLVNSIVYALRMREIQREIRRHAMRFCCKNKIFANGRVEATSRNDTQ